MISTTALGQQQSGRCAQQLGLQSLGGATGGTGRMRERGRGRGRGTERQTDRGTKTRCGRWSGQLAAGSTTARRRWAVGVYGDPPVAAPAACRESRFSAALHTCSALDRPASGPEIPSLSLSHPTHSPSQPAPPHSYYTLLFPTALLWMQSPT